MNLLKQACVVGAATIAAVTNICGGYAMETKIRSENYTLRMPDVAGGKISINIPHGNVIIDRNGPAQVDYYFEYNANKASQEIANTVFSNCSVLFSNGELKAQYPKLDADAWLGAYYHITIPAEYSLSVMQGSGKFEAGGIKLLRLDIELDSGRIAINNTQIAGGLRLVIDSGRIELNGSEIVSLADLSVHSGRVDVKAASLRDGGSVTVHKGRISYEYSPSSVGSILYSATKSDVETAAGITNDGNRLSSGKGKPEVRLAVKKGRISLKLGK